MGKIFNAKELRKDLIFKRVVELNIGLRDAAKLIGISPATLSRIENEKLCDVETFAKCYTWLQMNPGKYFRGVLKNTEWGFINKYGIFFKKRR